MQADDIIRGAGSRRAAGTRTMGHSAQPQLPPDCQTWIRNPVLDFFSPHRPRGDNSEPMNSHQCNEFHLPRNGTTAGAAQLLLILPPWRMLSPIPLPAEPCGMNEDIPQVSQGTIWAVMNVHCPQPHCWDTGMTLSHPYLVLSLRSQRIRHPRSKPGARGFNCDRVAYSRQLPTGWKRGEGW